VLSVEHLEYTFALLFRLRAYYLAQAEINRYLMKKVKRNAADFFVETVSFYLKAFLETQDVPLVVRSEQTVGKGLRPDISIWKNDHPVAFIECKTQLGWNRGLWETDFGIREHRLTTAYDKSSAYLLIATNENWTIPDSARPYLGVKYFVLSKLWPSKISDERLADTILNPIEGLFQQIVERC
jgi:hypothetical protein